MLTGTAAAQHAGPAIVFAFMVAGLGCVFAGLCYSEFASMIPIAGLAYTYGYATLGELIAWIIDWDLILEYLFAAATVAAGWSVYRTSFLQDIGIVLPPSLTNAPGALVQPPGSDTWVRLTPDARICRIAPIGARTLEAGSLLILRSPTSTIYCSRIDYKV